MMQFIIGIILLCIGLTITTVGTFMTKDGWLRWHNKKEDALSVSVKSESQSGGITANQVTINNPTINVDSRRRISVSLKNQLIEDFKSIGNTPITISITSSDSEAFQYAQDIIAVLNEAGCKIGAKERVFFNPEYPGLNVKIANEEISKDADILLKAVQKLDSDAVIIKDKRFGKGYLALIVGSKRR